MAAVYGPFEHLKLTVPADCSRAHADRSPMYEVDSTDTVDAVDKVVTTMDGKDMDHILRLRVWEALLRTYLYYMDLSPTTEEVLREHKMYSKCENVNIEVELQIHVPVTLQSTLLPKMHRLATLQPGGTDGPVTVREQTYDDVKTPLGKQNKNFLRLRTLSHGLDRPGSRECVNKVLLHRATYSHVEEEGNADQTPPYSYSVQIAAEGTLRPDDYKRLLDNCTRIQPRSRTTDTCDYQHRTWARSVTYRHKKRHTLILNPQVSGDITSYPVQLDATADQTTHDIPYLELEVLVPLEHIASGRQDDLHTFKCRCWQTATTLTDALRYILAS